MSMSMSMCMYVIAPLTLLGPSKGLTQLTRSRGRLLGVLTLPRLQRVLGRKLVGGEVLLRLTQPEYSTRPPSVGVGDI